MKEFSLMKTKNIGDAVVDRKTEQSVLRALDARIAESVFGWSDLIYLQRPDYFAGFPPLSDRAKGFIVRTVVPSYSESVEAAMQVVEKMRERGYRWNAQTPHGKGWEIQCYRPAQRGRGEKFKGLLPEAICRAALHAMECLSVNNRGTDGPAS